MSTPMKIPRTMNEQYKIIRAEDEEQRKRKTCVKREATVSPVCRRIMGALRAPIPPSHGDHVDAQPSHGDHMNPHILPISIPTGDAIISPSATTPHARPFESQPNSPW